MRCNNVEKKVSSKINNFPASEEIPCMLLIPNAHFFVHSNSPMAHIINQMKPVHNLPPIL